MYSQIISVGYRNFPFALCVPFGKCKGKCTLIAPKRE